MREAKRKRLESKGWKIGSAREFLNLSSEESAYIEMKVELAEGLRAHRERQNLTQVELAKLVKSSQSRVAKMEAGDPSVSLDLLVRSLLALGASKKEVAKIISPAKRSAATPGFRRAPLLARRPASRC
jgi:DNA-binding XRE family transcriptional regulator